MSVAYSPVTYYLLPVGLYLPVTCYRLPVSCNWLLSCSVCCTYRFPRYYGDICATDLCASDDGVSACCCCEREVRGVCPNIPEIVETKSLMAPKYDGCCEVPDVVKSCCGSE